MTLHSSLSFVDHWWLKEVWFGPGSFYSNCCTRGTFPAGRITRGPSERFCHGTLSQNVQNIHPTCHCLLNSPPDQSIPNQGGMFPWGFGQCLSITLSS